jgi:hypothetical protein
VGADFKLNNLTLLYKNYGNENRTRVNKILPGAASINGAGGNIARDTYDDLAGTMLSEFGVVYLNRNKGILVQNDVIL